MLLELPPCLYYSGEKINLELIQQTSLPAVQTLIDVVSMEMEVVCISRFLQLVYLT